MRAAVTARSSRRCPCCRRDVEWEGNPWRPFCSERCQIIDLGAWADERYRVAGTHSDSDASSELEDATFHDESRRDS
ncbi:MAG: DNA gyrase inhibitor YacG [Nitrospirae bacterium]|nr:DNA gyrase inhibitor YacG [Nitrospirota bacterium]